VNKVNGIFYDLGGRISPGVSNGKITFADGFVSIYGRRVYVEKDTSVTVTLDSSAYGIAVIRADTSANTVTLELKEAASSYPSLTQTNLLEEEGVFELPVCYYRKTASSLTVDTSPLVYIRTDKDQLDSAKDEINGTIGSKQYGIKTDYIAYNSYSDWKAHVPPHVSCGKGHQTGVFLHLQQPRDLQPRHPRRVQLRHFHLHLSRDYLQGHFDPIKQHPDPYRRRHLP
jgi:hypothetical protein